MSKNALLVLRIGLALTLIGVGILMWLQPTIWHSALLPWAQSVKIGGSSLPVLRAFSVLYVVLALMLLAGLWTWLAALAVSIAMVIVLAASGINNLSISAVGLLGAALAIYLSTAPERKKR